MADPKASPARGPLPAPQTQHERPKASAEASDLKKPKEVWKVGETTPTADDADQPLSERVGDSADLGAASPSPYGVEKQADKVGAQTARDGKPHRVKDRK